MKTRRNGARDVSTLELKVLKRLVKGGHKDEVIGDMLGRTTLSVRGIREYYGLTNQANKGAATPRFTDAEYEKIDERIGEWVEVEKLSAKEMAVRLAHHHPPGLHWATILRRINKKGGATKKRYAENMSARKSRQMQRRHIKGGCRKQKRGYRAHFIKEDEGDGRHTSRGAPGGV